MLTSLRKSAASWLAKLLFALLILSFAAWGIGDYLAPEVDDAVARVGESEIPAEEFRRDYARRLNGLRRQFGAHFSPELAAQFGLAEEVLDAVVRRQLVELEAGRLGLVVGDDQVSNAILMDTSFHGALGAFDRALFERLLLANGLSEGQFVALMRRDIQRRQIDRSVERNAAAPRAMAEALFRHRNEKRVATVIRVPKDAEIAEEPGEAALRDYLEANKDAFMAPAYRAVTAIVLDPDQWLDRVETDPLEVREIYDARIEDFTIPEVRTVRQMLFDDETQARDAAARLRTGADFAAAAGELGVTVSDLGSVSRDQLPEPSLADAAFGLEAPGPVEEPVNTVLGWHVLTVDAIEPGSVTPFEDLEEGLRREIARERAIELLAEVATDLDDQLGGGASFEEAAGALDLTLLELPAVDASGLDRKGEQPDGLPAGRAFLRTAFSTPVGEDSLVLDLEDGGHFVLRVEGETPVALRSFEDARDDLAEAWRADRIDEAAKARAEALARELREGRAPSAVAGDLALRTSKAIMRTESDREAGLAGEAVASVFAADKGEVVVAEAQGSYAVAVVDTIEPPAHDEEAIEGIREELSAGMAVDVVRQYHQALEDRFGVTVNRDLLTQYN